MIKITARKDGPYKVEGDNVEIVDANGKKYVAERPFFLCRCGASKTRPFCDGTHSKIGFKAAETAPD